MKMKMFSATVTSRHIYIERGNAGVLEHVLASASIPGTSAASASLASYVPAVTQPHFTADLDAIESWLLHAHAQCNGWHTGPQRHLHSSRDRSLNETGINLNGHLTEARAGDTLTDRSLL